MPRVQTFGQRQVRTENLPDARATNAPGPDAFGAGLARGLGQLGGVLAEMGHKAARRADEVALLAADNQMAAFESEGLRGPQGALTVKGTDSFDLPETFAAKYNAFADEIESTLTNDRQRFQFALQRSSRLQQTDMTLRRHVLREIQAYDFQESQTGVINSIDAAVANALDPAVVAQELDRGIAIIKDFSAANGVGPEATQARIAETQSNVHSGVVKRLLDLGRDRQARIYFDETKDEIKGSELGGIEKALNEGTVRGDSQQSADAIMEQAGSAEEAREMARSIEDPEIRDATITRVNRRISEDRDSEKENHDAQLITALNLIDTQGSVDAVPPSLWTSLTAQERVTFENYATRKANGDLETNWSTYYRHFQAASDPRTATQWARTNLMLSRDQLGDTEFKQLVGLQRSILNADTKSDDLLDDGRTQLQVVNQALTSVGMDPTPKSEKDQAKVAEFRRALAERVRAWQVNTGRKAGNGDVEQIADEMLMDVEVTNGLFSAIPFVGGFFDKTKRAFDLTIEDVPAEDRTLIRKGLGDRKLPVSDDAVLNIWRQQQAINAREQ